MRDDAAPGPVTQRSASTGDADPSPSSGDAPTSSGQAPACNLVLLADDGEVDVLQAGPTAHVAPRLEAGLVSQLVEVAQRQDPPGGQDPDRARQLLGLVQVVGADHQRAAG